MTANPAAFSADVASAERLAGDDGTAMTGGPFDTTTVTVEPRRTALPAGGWVPMTAPRGTVSS